MILASSLRIEVVGAGTVGGATGRALDDWGHDVVFKDIDEEILEELEDEGRKTARPDEEIDTDLTLIAVPTPYDEEDDEMKTAVVETAFETVSEQDPSVVAVRSTVPPGTTERLASEHDISDYAMVPEFLFADSARQDLEEMESIVIGTRSDLARETIKCAFGPQVSTFIELTPTGAEFLKFGSNIFGATKISFANEMWRLVHELRDERVVSSDVDPDQILSGLRQITPWTGADMAFEGGWPYGGHCLPKDTRGLRAWAENNHGVAVPQLSGTIEENELLETYEKSTEEPEPVLAE
ncbi:hypothetical protein AB7C87_16355 [Natrarchaeobius sp. A-rgal3]|uniref:hypothetical protein n=1 Tax=Natrarchaeobius versutus TaxID=1679078 RepID=UPI00350EE5F5